jgi:hypothetical protein
MHVLLLISNVSALFKCDNILELDCYMNVEREGFLAWSHRQKWWLLPSWCQWWCADVVSRAYTWMACVYQKVYLCLSKKYSTLNCSRLSPKLGLIRSITKIGISIGHITKIGILIGSIAKIGILIGMDWEQSEVTLKLGSQFWWASSDGISPIKNHKKIHQKCQFPKFCRVSLSKLERQLWFPDFVVWEWSLFSRPIWDCKDHRLCCCLCL